MKANELMIGDHVSHFDEEKNCVVTELRERNVAVSYTDDNGNTKYSELLPEMAFEPIPITAEILEKIGFWYEQNVGYVMEEDEYEIIYDLLDHKLRILKNREQILSLEYWGEMCVHELQHALRLCNIDKEIEI